MGFLSFRCRLPCQAMLPALPGAPPLDCACHFWALCLPPTLVSKLPAHGVTAMLQEYISVLIGKQGIALEVHTQKMLLNGMRSCVLLVVPQHARNEPAQRC